ncbi:TonB-dependent receptor [Porphyrobacter sp. GA68]|uniref:TonB-dependent receptor n=1 Tax=Porphyrobacter sp. GA68 TaxID=2883480 RepID=UPI001D182296|nr:TonB-dependent receptor [Porphyrobacter sp. GA68]
MRHLLKATLLLTTCVGTPALAQEVGPPDGETQGTQTIQAGNEIIVTARKREETLQDVPTTVAVTTADTIARLALNSLEDMSKTLPGLVFDESFGRNSSRPVIRGQANLLGQSGVAFFIDGIYFTGSLADYDVDTIERLEVVKGPQSALYGRNTYSGAINVISKFPGDTWEGRVTADLAQHDRYEITAGIRGPVTDGLSVGVNGRFYDFGGEYTNLFDGEKVGQQSSWSVSGLARWDNGGPFTANLRAYYNRTDDGQPALFQQSANENNCLPDRGALYGGSGRYYCGTIRPQAINTDYRRQFTNVEDVGLEADFYAISLRMDYQLSDRLTLTSLTGYNNREETQLTDGDYSPESFQTAVFASFPLSFTPAPPPRRAIIGLVNSTLDFSFANLAKVEDWSQELRLTYQSEALDIIVGGYFFDQSDDSFSIREVPPDALARAQANLTQRRNAICAANPICLATAPLTPLTAVPNPRDENLLQIRNVAAFGAVTFHLTTTLNLGFEGRYAEERIRQTAFDFDEGQQRPLPVFAERTFRDFSPRVLLDWQATPDNLVYAIFAQGQKPGGFNGPIAIAFGAPTYNAEDVTSYELGFKNRLLGGALVANLAMFHNEIEGYQLTQTTFVPPNSFSAITNAGNARVNGAELELIARPGSGFTITANYALADSRFTSGFDENQGVLNDVADDGLVNCSTGDQAPQLAGCQSAFGSIKGKRIPRAPVHRVFADVDYRTPLGDSGWNAFIGGNVTLTSSSFAQVHNLAKTGDATVVDARIGVENSRFRIQGYVRNLTNEDAVQQVLRFADANNDLRRSFVAGLRPGRSFGVILEARY